LPLVLWKGSGRVSTPCRFLMLPRLKPVRAIQAFNMSQDIRIGEHLYFFFVCIIITPILICGCSHFDEGFQAKPTFKEANDLFSQGSYKDSLSKYG
jgi:hypothetical protein